MLLTPLSDLMDKAWPRSLRFHVRVLGGSCDISKLNTAIVSTRKTNAECTELSGTVAPEVRCGASCYPGRHRPRASRTPSENHTARPSICASSRRYRDTRADQRGPHFHSTIVGRVVGATAMPVPTHGAGTSVRPREVTP